MKPLAILVWLAVISVDLSPSEFNPPPEPPATGREAWEL